MRYVLLILGCCAACAVAADPIIDVRNYEPDCGVQATKTADGLTLSWPIAPGKKAQVKLRLGTGEGSLIKSIGLLEGTAGDAVPLLNELDPEFVVTVGERTLEGGTDWRVFFDKPYTRPSQAYRAQRAADTAAIVTSQAKRLTVTLTKASAGPFSGTLEMTCYSGSPLIRFELAMATTAPACAYIYDAGLASAQPDWISLNWRNPQGKMQQAERNGAAPASVIAARLRAVVAESSHGAVTVFPPPHQFIFPLDSAENFGFNWVGAQNAQLIPHPGFGVHQTFKGDNRWVPWVNAPAGSMQRMAMFVHVSAGNVEQALNEVGAYTHNDTFVPVAGKQRFTSHYHNEHTYELNKAQQGGKSTAIPSHLVEPEFVRGFIGVGFDIVHLAEFHGGAAAIERPWSAENERERLRLLWLMNHECQRLSADGRLLVIPGEEPDVILGGHWISMFPKPIMWANRRAKDGKVQGEYQVEDPQYGTIYRVGSSADILNLFTTQNGLLWTAHPRIKKSFGYPDAYKDSDFFRSDRYLGGTWKAMPADLSQPRLGDRSLDLASDMANWGERKYILGEGDLFRISTEYELYGHLSVNYLELSEKPRFDAGWAPVCDALRSGRFYTTTGEMLCEQMMIAGKSSGEEAVRPAGDQVAINAKLAWTFPPAFAEVVWGDGTTVKTEKIDLSDQPAFSNKAISLTLHLPGVKWARFQAWDVAANGLFTPPVWFP